MTIIIFSFLLCCFFFLLACISLYMFMRDFFYQLYLLLSYLDSPIIRLSPAPRSLSAVCNRALQPHLRYDNQLISQQSPFPRGSFVCKILTLI